MTITRNDRPLRWAIAAIVVAALLSVACGDKKGQAPPLPTDEGGNAITPIPS